MALLGAQSAMQAYQEMMYGEHKSDPATRERWATLLKQYCRLDGDDAIREYIAKMGQALGELFHALRVEFADLLWRCQQFNELFSAGDERLVLINSKAPLFFWLVQDAGLIKSY